MIGYIWYLTAPSKAPALKGIPFPMSPRTKSPSQSASKATSRIYRTYLVISTQ